MRCFSRLASIGRRLIAPGCLFLAQGLAAQPALLPDETLGPVDRDYLRPLEQLVWSDAWTARTELEALAPAVESASRTEGAAYFLLLAQALQYLHLNDDFYAAIGQGLASLDDDSPARLRLTLGTLDGVRLGREGRFEDATDRLRDVMNEANTAGMSPVATLAAAELGFVHTLAGDHEAAMGVLQAAHADAVALRDRFLVAAVNEVLGAVYTYLDEFDTAVRHYRMALSDYERLDYQIYIAEAVYGIGITYRYARQWDEAIDALRRYRRLTEGRSSPHGAFYAAYGLGTTYADMGDCEAALPVIAEALALTGPSDYDAELHKRAAVCHAELGDGERARAALERARDIIGSIPELEGTRWEIDLYRREGEMWEALGDFEAAYRAMQRYLEEKTALLERNASERRLAQREALENERQALEIALLQEQARVRALEIETQKRDLRLQRLRIAVLLCVVAIASALVYLRVRESRRLKHLSTTDPLTGVWNRRYVFEMLGELLERTPPERGSVSVLLIDVDDFKVLNDRHGHPVGDAVLVALGEALTDMLRPGDVVARVGGEEFMVVLPRCAKEEARGIADRINERIRELSVPSDRERARVTASIGVATSSADCSSPEALYAAADGALYRAKDSGKDRAASG